ncbi:MAG: transcriptional regulator, GntR family [Eubacterium sp.]|nr:transcriptional regulator, GntR family [Eubacterium sp.]
MLDFSTLILNNKDPVYIQISNFVKKKILLRHAETGTGLPSRREVAAILNINPNTAQKAFKLMEDEGFIVTNTNVGSMIYLNEEIYSRIESELTELLVHDFVQGAKEVNLSYKKVIQLITDMWEDN